MAYRDNRGGHNRKFTGKEPTRQGSKSPVKVDSWGWYTTKRTWTRKQIENHLKTWLFDHGISTTAAAGNTVHRLAGYHYWRHLAIRATDSGKDTIHGRNALTLELSCAAGITDCEKILRILPLPKLNATIEDYAESVRREQSKKDFHSRFRVDTEAKQREIDAKQRLRAVK